MKIKLVDILFLIGFLLTSIGFFILHTIVGFVGAGIGLMGISYLIYLGGGKD